MILNKNIINDLKEKSGLLFDQTKDIEALASIIFNKTGRSIGVTTLKRLLGLIDDARNSNEYTLNTIAIFLGFRSWAEYTNAKNFDSIWSFDENAVLIKDLSVGSKIQVHYLNRIVDFVVVNRDGISVLKVLNATNSSLHIDDILYVHKITKGMPLEADMVVRGSEIGNYKTNGEVKLISVTE